MLATLPGRTITDADVRPRLDALKQERKALDAETVQETVEDVVDDALLAAEAKAAAFAPPAGEGAPDAASDEGLAAAWAKAKILPAAQTSVSDADLARWFDVRRGVARIVFRDEERALKAKAELDTISGDASARREAFAKAKRRITRRPEVFPDGVLVDKQGGNEVGEQVLPVEAATALFALAAEGDVSAPVKAGDSWVIVMHLGERPGTPVAQVPEDQKKAASDKIAAKRAMDHLEEHIARLRKDQGVVIDEAAVGKLARSIGIETVTRLKKLPFGARKAHLSRSGGRVDPVPGRRPDNKDAERFLQEKLQEKAKGKEQDGGAGAGGQCTTPGAQP